MKSICYKIFPLLLSVLVLLTTTLQFHHHDCHGSIYFTIPSEKDVVVNFNDGHLSFNECHHHYMSNPEHEPDCYGHKCSMHIDQPGKFRQQAMQNILLIAVFDIFLNSNKKLELSEWITQVYSCDDSHSQRRLLQIIRSSSIFRAPPVMWRF